MSNQPPSMDDIFQHWDRCWWPLFRDKFYDKQSRNGLRIPDEVYDVVIRHHDSGSDGDNDHTLQYLIWNIGCGHRDNYGSVGRARRAAALELRRWYEVLND